MIDLIYGPKEWFEEIIARFPDARFEDARDPIHGERFQVEIPSLPTGLEDVWISALLELSLAPYSLLFQIAIYDEKEHAKIMCIFEDYKSRRKTNG